MSHELTKRANGMTEMAYVGDKPWHGLGQLLTKGASIDVWRKEAGLDWEALKANVQYHNRDGLLLPYTGKVVLYRSDNCEPVGLVSDQFKPVQPGELLETFRSLIEGAGWYIHTAGTLRGGSKLWVMASHDDLRFQVGQDSVKLHMLAATALDGSMKTRGKLVSERVVCANTLRVALAEGGEEVTISHRAEFDADDMKDSLGVSVRSLEEFHHSVEQLASKAIGTPKATEILRTIFGKPTEKAINPTAPDAEFQRLMAKVTGNGADVKLREQRSVARCLELFQGEGIGSELATARGTAWGLVNAVTQHVDHEMSRTASTRMENAWFGRGEVAKSTAFALALEA